MPPPSQYQARRLLELVSSNKARVRPTEHVDADVWARCDPPVRGLNYPSREIAKFRLRSGELGAIHDSRVRSAPNPHTAQLPDLSDPETVQMHAGPQRADADKGAIPGVHPRNLPIAGGAGANPMPRAESSGSKMSKISSVPSFGKMREPLSGDSVRLESQEHEERLQQPQGRRPRVNRAAPAEYEEFGSEALITHVYDELEDEFEDSTPSALFQDIGPSISMAHSIGKAVRPSERAEDQYRTNNDTLDDLEDANFADGLYTQQIATPTLEPRQSAYDERDDFLMQRNAPLGRQSVGQSSEAYVDERLNVDLAPRFPIEEDVGRSGSAGRAGVPTPAPPLPAPYRSQSYKNTVEVPPAPPLPPYAMESYDGPEHADGESATESPIRPPPPPPPLYTVESYGSRPAVPPPPSPPPPKKRTMEEQIQELRISGALRDTDDSSPVTESGEVGYEFGKRRDGVHDEFSDLADNSLPSMIKGQWYKEYAKAHGSEVESEGDVEVESLEEAEVESTEEAEIESVEEEEYEGNNAGFTGRRMRELEVNFT